MSAHVVYSARSRVRPPLPSKPEVKTFDVFDTLVARFGVEPRSVFEAVERSYPWPGFASARCAAEGRVGHGTDDQIFAQFQAITGCTDAERNALQRATLQAELSAMVPIRGNMRRVKPADVLVSDMYYDSATIMALLRAAGFEGDVRELVLTAGGKSTGTVWRWLLQRYNIVGHLGDNEHSDVRQARALRIPATLSTVHALTQVEARLRDAGYRELAHVSRAVRLQNPYEAGSLGARIFEEQARINVPVLLLASHCLARHCRREGFRRLLFATRDATLWERLFRALCVHTTSLDAVAEGDGTATTATTATTTTTTTNTAVYARAKDVFDVRRFCTSRRLFLADEPLYVPYVRRQYEGEWTSTIIVDLQGSGDSSRVFFDRCMSGSGDDGSPAARLAGYFLVHRRLGQSETHAGLVQFQDGRIDHRVEALNFDMGGSYVGMRDDGSFVRDKPENADACTEPIQQACALVEAVLQRHAPLVETRGEERDVALIHELLSMYSASPVVAGAVRWAGETAVVCGDRTLTMQTLERPIAASSSSNADDVAEAADTSTAAACEVADAFTLQRGDLAFAHVRWVDDRLYFVSVPIRNEFSWPSVNVVLDGKRCHYDTLWQRRGNQQVLVAAFRVPPTLAVYGGSGSTGVATQQAKTLRVVFPDKSTFSRDVTHYQTPASQAASAGPTSRPHIPTYELVAMTLCKDDHALLPLWVAHHRRLGVQHFFVYYNGVWPRDALAAYRAAMPGIVTFVDWPLPYWIAGGVGDHHCAQTTAMNDFLHWSRSFATWALFCDLDEYVHLRSKCVDLRDARVDAYLFKNRWAVFRERAMVDVDDVRLDGPWLLDGREYPAHKGEIHRGKMIVRVSAFSTVSIHHPNEFWKRTTSSWRTPRQFTELKTKDAFHCHLQNSVKNNLGRFSEAAETVSPSDSLSLR